MHCTSSQRYLSQSARCVCVNIAFLVSSIQLSGQDTSMAARLLEEAVCFTDSIQYMQAHTCAILALDMYEAKGLELKIADACYWAGLPLARSGRRQEGIAYLVRCLEIRERVLGSQHPETGEVYTALAEAYVGVENILGKMFTYKSLANARTMPDPVNPDAGYAHMLLARYYSQDGNYDSVLYHAVKSLETHRASKNPDLAKLGQALNQMGWYYDYRGDLHKAWQLFEESDRTLRNALPENHPLHSNTMMALGNILIYQDKYEEALTYLFKAFDIRKTIFPEVSPIVAACYQSIGIAFHELGRYDDARKYNLKCIAINDKLYGPRNRWSANVYNNLGMNYAALHRIDSAKICYQLAIEHSIEAVGPDNFTLIYPFGNLAELYQGTGERDMEQKYLNECLRLCQKIFGEYYRETITSYTNLSRFVLKQGSIDEAMVFADRAVKGCHVEPSAELPFASVSYPKLLLDALHVRAQVHFTAFTSSGDIKDLRSAYKDVLHIEALVEHTRKSFSENESKQILAAASLPAYEFGIRVALEMYYQTQDPAYLESAFDFSEQNKGLAILEAIANTQADTYGSVPAALLDSLRSVQSDIHFVDETLRDSKSETDDERILSMRAHLSDLKLKYQRMLSLIETRYPEYYALKYELPAATLAEVRASLPEDHALLEYFAGDSTLYTFVVTRDTTVVAETSMTGLADRMRSFISALRSPLSSISEVHALGHHIYERCIEDVHVHLPGTLIIVPDGVLGYLPFEALASNHEGDAKGKIKYLLNEHKISYAHSGALWQNSALHQPGRRERLLAVAPSFNSREGAFSPLKYNISEARSIAGMVKSTALLEEEATLHAFDLQMPRHTILHLATHAQADDQLGDNAFLVFAGDSTNEYQLLHVRDIYGLRIPASMVVLSACDSGTGELRRGEGIISLSRAFAFAGTTCIVPTLWSVNDKATLDIVLAFYRNLKKGEDKALALTNAKLQFIENAAEPSLQHPYYWAGMIALGNTEAVDLGSSPDWIWLTLLLLVLVIGGVVLTLPVLPKAEA